MWNESARNHRHTEINSAGKLDQDLFVSKLKLPVEFYFEEKGAKLVRM